jgi:hypothetical protein
VLYLLTEKENKMKNRSENKTNRNSQNKPKSMYKTTVLTYEQVVKDFYDGKNIKN